jgi:hypothetical protein
MDAMAAIDAVAAAGRYPVLPRLRPLEMPALLTPNTLIPIRTN